MHTDTRILHQHGGYDVLPFFHRVRWPADSSVVALHPVRFHGHDDPFLRAVQQDDLHWIIFDLRDVTPPDFEADLKRLPPQDAQGLVFYTLRGAYPNAAALLAKALAHFRAAWIAEAPLPLDMVQRTRPHMPDSLMAHTIGQHYSLPQPSPIHAAA